MNIDLNSDLGGGYGAWTMGDDQALLDFVSSANIACGFHAGDPTSMRRTVDWPSERGVAIGAHVSYPDRRGFGRYDLNLPADQVRDDVLYQIGALEAFARSAGTRVSYVKPPRRRGRRTGRVAPWPPMSRGCRRRRCSGSGLRAG